MLPDFGSSRPCNGGPCLQWDVGGGVNIGGEPAHVSILFCHSVARIQSIRVFQSDPALGFPCYVDSTSYVRFPQATSPANEINATQPDHVLPLKVTCPDVA